MPGRWRRCQAGLFGLLLCVGVGAGVAADLKPLQVRYLGLHSKEAKVTVDRRSYRLSPGETVKDRLMLISATRAEAVFAIDGAVYRYPKGHKRGEPLPDELVLKRDVVGMFEVVGAINGAPVPFLVDTGATFITITDAHARKLGLKYSKRVVIDIHTASRVEKAYLIELGSVRVGGIVRFGVPAVVMKGPEPRVPLLGNSFLGTLAISQKDDYMLLRSE